MRYVIKLNDLGNPTEIECIDEDGTHQVQMRRHPMSTSRDIHRILDAEFSVVVHRLGRRRYLEACGLAYRVYHRRDMRTLEILEGGIPDNPVNLNYDLQNMFVIRRPLDKLGKNGFTIDNGNLIIRCSYCQRLITAALRGGQYTHWGYVQAGPKAIMIAPCITCKCEVHWSCVLVGITYDKLVELLKEGRGDFSEPSPAAASPPPTSPTAEPSVPAPS